MNAGIDGLPRGWSKKQQAIDELLSDLGSDAFKDILRVPKVFLANTEDYWKDYDGIRYEYEYFNRLLSRLWEIWWKELKETTIKPVIVGDAPSGCNMRYTDDMVDALRLASETVIHMDDNRRRKIEEFIDNGNGIPKEDPYGTQAAANTWFRGFTEGRPQYGGIIENPESLVVGCGCGAKKTTRISR